MFQVVYIITAFPSHTKPKAFDILQLTFRFESDSIGHAVENALARSRRIFDDDDNRRALGYPRKPVLYAVADVEDDLLLPRGMPDSGECMLLKHVATFDEAEMERLRSFQGVPVPLRIIDVPQPAPGPALDAILNEEPVSDRHIDDLLLSFSRPEGRTVVMMVSCVMEACEMEGIEVRPGRIVSRVYALLEQKKLIPKDVTAKGEYSQVCLAAGGGAAGMRASDQQLDAFILAAARTEWRKVAMIMARVMEVCEQAGLGFEEFAIGAHIGALVGRGKLQSTGDLSRWRHSEVRLPSDEVDNS